MKENSIRRKEDTPRKRQEHQMPERGNGSGKPTDARPHAFFAKEVGEVDEPQGTTLAERHPDWPEITVRFYFSAHNDPSDITGIADVLADADVYFFESSGETATKFLQDIAEGKIAGFSSIDAYIDRLYLEDTPLKETIYGPIMQALYEHQTPVVGHMDLRNTEINLIRRIDEIGNRNYIADTFDATLQNLDDNILAYAAVQGAREAIIAQRFEEEMENIVHNPRLQGKTNLTVVSSMGSAHKSLQELFTQRGIQTESTTDHKPGSHDFHIHAYQSVQQGGTLTKDTLAKVYLFKELLEALPFEKTYDNKVAYLYPVISALNTKEIESYHDDPTIGNLNLVLSRKGMLPFPTTSAELHSLAFEMPIGYNSLL